MPDNSIASVLKSYRKNAGIELLRIVSILFVVTLHVLGQGGIFGAAGADPHSANNVVAVTFEMASFGAVTLFALVSGYVALRSKWATKKWLRLWAMVAFWGLVMTFLVDKTVLLEGFNTFLKGIIPGTREDFEAYTVAGNEYVNALLPIFTKQYWYFNMYTLLFLLMPLLNAAIAATSKRKLALICAAAVFGVSLYSAATVFYNQGFTARFDIDRDTFGMGGGYNAMWLVLMYLVGACVRRYHDEGFKPKKWLCLLGYLLCVGASVGWWFLFSDFIDNDPQHFDLLNLRRGIAMSYTSPLVVIGSVCLLCLFMQLDFSNKRARRFVFTLSGSSFAVYIIHTQLVVWQYFMKGRFADVAAEPTGWMILELLVAVVTIYLVCTVLELLRKTLFEVTRLDKGIDRLGDAVDRGLKRLAYGKKVK